MAAFKAAKTMYVLQEMLLKDGPTTITTTKLKVQFDAGKNIGKIGILKHDGIDKPVLSAFV